MSSPSYHQCPSSSVSSAQTTNGGRPRAARYASQRRDDVSDEFAGVLSRSRASGLAVVRAAADRERPQAVERGRVVVPVDGIGRVPRAVPDQRDRLPVDRHRDRAGRGRQRLELGEGVIGGRLVHAERAHAGRLELLVEPGPVGALGQPEAAAPAAEAGAVRSDPGRELQLHSLLGGQQRQHGVGRGRGPELDRTGVLERAEARRAGRGRAARIPGPPTHSRAPTLAAHPRHRPGRLPPTPRCRAGGSRRACRS